MHFVDFLIIFAFIAQAVFTGLRFRKIASQNLEEYFAPQFLGEGNLGPLFRGFSPERFLARPGPELSRRGMGQP